jgi:hypothetical protein
VAEKSEAQRIWDAWEARHSAQCPVCGRGFVPLRGGTIRRHTRHVFAGTFYRSETCPGGGQKADGRVKKV